LRVHSASRLENGASLRVVNRSGERRSLVLSLPWRPGIKAALAIDGVPMPPQKILRSEVGLVVLDVPARFDGSITVHRHYPYLRGVIVWTSLGIATILVAVTWLLRTRDRGRSTPGSTPPGARP
jgi:hypothetical protein